jgi:hypothetical protein
MSGASGLFGVVLKPGVAEARFAAESARSLAELKTAIEAFTAVLLQLNIRYKTRVAPKLTGIKGDPREARPS